MLRDQFNRDFLEGAGQAFGNPLQQQRFRQLQMQYQGYGAFSDPTLQDELQLSAEQIVRFNRMQEQWNEQLQQLQQGGQDGRYFRDADGREYGYREKFTNNANANGQNLEPSQQFEQLLRQRWHQINNILDDDQRYRYYKQVGAPHDFPMETYLQGVNNGVNANNAPAAAGQAGQGEGGGLQGASPQGNAPGANTPQRSTTPQSPAPGTGQGGGTGVAPGATPGQSNPRG